MARCSRAEVHTGGRSIILVVDDEAAIRHLLGLLLRQHGFEVWTASDGMEALELCRQHSQDIAVVLLDVCMPGQNGPQTLKALRAVVPDLVVCFMTGHASLHDREELQRLGAADVFSKPFDLECLVRQMQTLSPSPCCAGSA